MLAGRPRRAFPWLLAPGRDAIGAIGPFAVLTGTLLFWWLDSKVG